MQSSETPALPIVPRNPCRTCSRCCRAYAVPINGQDVWKIWRSQRLSPDKFAVPVQVESDRPDSFRLAAKGGRLLLILDKKGALKPDSPCVFLLQLPGGFDRCAIYQDRPAACRVYPMVQAPGKIEVNTKALCPPNSWTDEDTARETWRVVVREADLQYDVYSLVVAHWNDHVERYPNRQFGLDEFYGFLYNVYERIAALDQVIPAEDYRAVQQSWGHAAGDDPTAARPWIQYVEEIQQILDSFYPRLNPKVTAD